VLLYKWLTLKTKKLKKLLFILEQKVDYEPKERKVETFLT